MNGTNTNLPNYFAVFEALHSDMHYTVRAQNSITLHLTNEIACTDGITALYLAQQLIDAISKSDELPFIIERTLDGNQVSKRFAPIADSFYKFRNGNHNIPHLPTHQLSEAVQVLVSVTTALKIDTINLSGNPLNVLNIDGFLEGELINSFVLRVREFIRSKQTTRQIEQRKSQVQSDIRETKRYVERIVASTPNLLIQRVDLHHLPHASQTISLHESNQHKDQFIEALKSHPELGSPVGWWWKREHLAEIGFVYSMVIFYDTSHRYLDPLVVTTLLEISWQNVTDNQGGLTLHNSSSNSHKWLGNGFISPVNPYISNDLLSSLRLMILRDTYLRFSPNTKHSHIGMGPLPKRIKDQSAIPTFATHLQSRICLGL